MSFNKDANNSDENPLTNQEIKTILLNVYDRLTKPSTKEVGYDLLLKLILKHLYTRGIHTPPPPKGEGAYPESPLVNFF